MTTPARPVVLVTGAARRLGRTLALDFGRRGWSVAAHVHRAGAEADEMVAEIERAGGSGRAFVADLADIAAAEGLMRQVVDWRGGPECLVNNASLFVYDDAESLSAGQWDRHFAINLRAPVFLTQAMSRYLPADRTGVVINILDQRVWKPTPHFLSYAASKSALWAMTQMLAQALAPRIRVNAIGPGPMLRSVHQSEADFRAQYLATPLARPTEPEEVAAAVRYILDAPALTGQMLALDGGQHLAWRTPDIGDGHG